VPLPLKAAPLRLLSLSLKISAEEEEEEVVNLPGCWIRKDLWMDGWLVDGSGGKPALDQIPAIVPIKPLGIFSEGRFDDGSPVLGFGGCLGSHVAARLDLVVRGSRGLIV